MALLKNLVIASVISTAMITAAPSVMAAGKIENQTQSGLLETFDESIAAAEATLEALNNGADKEEVLALMKKSKQALNRIESATVNREKEKANGLLRKSRSAFKKDDIETSKALMVETVAKFKSLKQIFLSF